MLQTATNITHSLITYSYLTRYWSQYSKTNVMRFLFSLLRIKGLYMFQTLLAHLHEALHKWHLVYCVHVMSFGCNNPSAANWHNTHAIIYKCRSCSASWRWASNAQNMYRPLILNKLNKTCITLVLLYWYTLMHGQHNIKFVRYWSVAFLQSLKFWHSFIQLYFPSTLKI
jgi:hypothetical protein